MKVLKTNTDPSSVTLNKGDYVSNETKIAVKI